MECSCIEPGWCQRHQRNKTPELWAACRTNEAIRAEWDRRVATMPNVTPHLTDAQRIRLDLSEPVYLSRVPRPQGLFRKSQLFAAEEFQPERCPAGWRCDDWLLYENGTRICVEYRLSRDGKDWKLARRWELHRFGLPEHLTQLRLPWIVLPGVIGPEAAASHPSDLTLEVVG